MNSLYDESPFLEHHGIKGQKWGVRRFQNPDGTLTAAGKKRYLKLQKKTLKDFSKAYRFGSDNTAAVQTLSKRSDTRNELKRLIEAKNRNKKFSEKEYAMSKRLAKEMFGFDNPEDVKYSGVLSKKKRKTAITTNTIKGQQDLKRNSAHRSTTNTTQQRRSP